VSSADTPYDDDEYEEEEEELEAFYKARGDTKEARSQKARQDRTQRLVTYAVLSICALIIFFYFLAQGRPFYAVGVLFVLGLVVIVINELMKEKT
jgi:hypothetical protein